MKVLLKQVKKESQFNYSRNITFDTKRNKFNKRISFVAIQLFAEYNF